MLKRALQKLSNDRILLNRKISPGLQAGMNYWIPWQLNQGCRLLIRIVDGASMHAQNY